MTRIRIIRMMTKKSCLKVYGTISIIFAHRQQLNLSKLKQR